MSEWLVTDNGTIALGVGLVAVLFLGNYFFPQSLVHPILLGRQSDVERVRRKGESAIYRNYSTGLMGRLPVRPAKEVEILSHLIKPNFQGTRTLWSTNLKNSELNERVSALSTGFIRVAGLLPRESNVLLLLNDSIEFLITDLALSSQSIPSFTLSSLTLFSSILESHPPSAIILHSHFLAQVLELIMDNSESRNHIIIVLGKKDLPKDLDRLGRQIRILDWEQLEADGSKEAKVEAVAVQADEVFSVAFFPGANGELRGSRLSHMNMTAAVASTRLLLPLESSISDKDVIVSAHSLTTPYGRAIAYTALYECASFTTTKSTELFKTTDAATDFKEEIWGITQSGSPSPTVLFINPSQLHSLINTIIQQSKRSLMFSLGWRQKLFGIQQGFVNKASLWDTLVFEPSRKAVMGNMNKTLKGVIVSGGLLEENIMTPTKLILSVPFVNAYTSPVVAGPICASHGFDLQSFRICEEQTNGNESLFVNVAHVGPPTINVEIKLTGVDDDAVEGGANPMGEMLVRGPTVALPVDVDDPLDGWVPTEEIAMIQPNGTCKIAGRI